MAREFLSDEAVEEEIARLQASPLVALALDVGQTVRICSDSCEAASVECTVAACGGAKFLTYRAKGQIKRFAIRDYPGRYYRRAEIERS